MLHQQAAADQSSGYAAEASGPSSASSSSFSPSFPSSSPPCASSSSCSSPDGSPPAPPLQPGSSRQSDAHARGQRPFSFDLSAPQSVPGSAGSTSNSALNAFYAAAETSIQATAAAAAASSTVSSLVEAAHDSSDTSLSASSDAMHSDEEQAGLFVGSRSQAALGLPSSCASRFSACVETCATTGLGLDALSTALLELANAPSLASGTFCMPSTTTFGDEDAQTFPAVAFACHMGTFRSHTFYNADCLMAPHCTFLIVHCTLRYNFDL